MHHDCTLWASADQTNKFNSAMDIRPGRWRGDCDGTQGRCPDRLGRGHGESANTIEGSHKQRPAHGPAARRLCGRTRIMKSTDGLRQCRPLESFLDTCRSSPPCCHAQWPQKTQKRTKKSSGMERPPGKPPSSFLSLFVLLVAIPLHPLGGDERGIRFFLWPLLLGDGHWSDRAGNLVTYAG